MIRGITLCESGNRGSGEIRILAGGRALRVIGKANSKGREVSSAASILVITRASASGARELALSRDIPVAAAEGPAVGTSIMGCDIKSKRIGEDNETSAYPCKEGRVDPYPQRQQRSGMSRRPDSDFCYRHFSEWLLICRNRWWWRKKNQYN